MEYWLRVSGSGFCSAVLKFCSIHLIRLDLILVFERLSSWKAPHKSLIRLGAANRACRLAQSILRQQQHFKFNPKRADCCRLKESHNGRWITKRFEIQTNGDSFNGHPCDKTSICVFLLPWIQAFVIGIKLFELSEISDQQQSSLSIKDIYILILFETWESLIISKDLLSRSRTSCCDAVWSQAQPLKCSFWFSKQMQMTFEAWKS